MAIPSQALVEPLLSRKHATVLRDIARAALLVEALKKVDEIAYSLKETNSNAQVQSISLTNLSEIADYLKAEIRWVLTQVKVPKHSIDQTKTAPRIKKNPTSSPLPGGQARPE